MMQRLTVKTTNFNKLSDSAPQLDPRDQIYAAQKRYYQIDPNLFPKQNSPFGIEINEKDGGFQWIDKPDY
jgi:hypothetical protein